MSAEDESSGSAVPVLPSGETTTGNQPEDPLVNQVFYAIQRLPGKLIGKQDQRNRAEKQDRQGGGSGKV